MAVRVGVDTGGTFADLLACSDDGQISAPRNNLAAWAHDPALSEELEAGVPATHVRHHHPDRVVDRPEGAEHEGLVIADIDPSDDSGGLPFRLIDRRRPDLYGDLLTPNPKVGSVDWTD